MERSRWLPVSISASRQFYAREVAITTLLIARAMPGLAGAVLTMYYVLATVILARPAPVPAPEPPRLRRRGDQQRRGRRSEREGVGLHRRVRARPGRVTRATGDDEPRERDRPGEAMTRPYPNGDGSTGTDLYLTQHGFETAFAGDVPRKLADQMWAEQRPFSQAAFESLSGEPA
jgi:hypothetical protein